jgi:hypothetical protein
VLNPSQTTLLITLAAPDVRHRVSAVSRVAGNAGIGIGGALGGLVATRGLTGFMALFLANAVSYLAYVAVLAAVVHESPRRQPVRDGYRVLLQDRAFLHLAVADVAMIAVGLLGVSPSAAFGVAAGVALAAAISMLRLERRLPEAARLTPRPRR